MNIRIWIQGLTLCCLTIQSHAQGTITFTFDGPPSVPGPGLPGPGQSFYVQQYSEAGMWFRPLGVIAPGNGFSRQRGGGQLSFAPDNGSAFIATVLGDSLQFSFTNGSSFNMVAVDLAEYSTVVPNAVTVPFYGYRADGSVVFTSFTTDGIIDGAGPLADFQTFYFGPEFSNLLRVEIPTFGWSLDNLVVSVPEPGLGALLMLAAAGFWLGRKPRE